MIVTLTGHPLDDPELLLSALDLGPGHAVEAIALSADLAAAENCFALFVARRRFHSLTCKKGVTHVR